MKKRTGSGNATKQVGKTKALKKPGRSYLPWILAIIGITAIAFSPMLKNGFTNWDDQYYVVQNPLLPGPDWAGIFTKSVLSNYHPVTIASFALNYAMTKLDPSSYLILNLLLHLANTGLVFYFIWLISGKRIWVSAFTSLVFAVHPMHVESVAWVSERKDVLYTIFFLLSLIQYWYFLTTKKKKNLVYCFLFFALSILSKPAAIILPFLLFLLDYWVGRGSWRKSIVEKIPFLLVSIGFAIATFMIQSKSAMAGLDYYPLWTRFFFASYTSMIYVVRFFVPYPLSAFHPFPMEKAMPLPMILSPAFIIALLFLLWWQRKNKLVVFSLFFFMINLVLVLQFVSIGGTLISERYTYVPYIGMAFLVGMLMDKYFASKEKRAWWAIPGVVVLIFAIMTHERTKVWKDSDTLWTSAIKVFPKATVARTNRANYLIGISARPENKERKNELLMRALEDCNVALTTKLNHARAYENRQNIYLRLNRDSLAMADANSLLRLEPRNKLGHYTKGSVYQRFQMPDSAIKYLNLCLEINPNTDYALNTRGSVLFNNYKKYHEALADFNKAIALNPQGDYFLNRSYCHYQLNQLDKAKADAIAAQQRGITISNEYKQLIKL